MTPTLTWTWTWTWTWTCTSLTGSPSLTPAKPDGPHPPPPA